MLTTMLRASAAAYKDLQWSKTVALLPGDGANNSTTMTDLSRSASNWTANGAAKISTAVKKYGTGSIYLDATAGTYISATAGSGYTFGTGDFTVEGWVYIAAATAVANGIFQQGTSLFPASVSNTVAFGTVTTGSKWQIYAKGASAQSTATWSTATWYHFAVVRSGTTTKLYINGTGVITVTSDSTNYTGTHFGVGSIYGAGPYLHNGYVDDLRITKGFARYTADFTAPTAAHPARG